MSALTGIRVIDVTHHIAGPTCTMLLGDYGAEVIKVEPMEGDPTRKMNIVDLGGQRATFLAVNRNKLSIGIDLQNEDGKELVYKLVRESDVFVENFRPGVADRLGLGFAKLAEINSRIIYCSINGFGSSGPYHDRPALDVVMQAMSGVMSITGEEQGEPLPCGAPIADFISGMQAVIGILLALQARERTGKGQKVEATMLNAMISAMGLRLSQYWGTGIDLQRHGSGHAQQMPYGTFQAADEPFVIAVTTPVFWSRFCQTIDRMDLESHSDYATVEQRVHNEKALRHELNAWFGTQNREFWLTRLVKAGVPCSPVHSVSELVRDEHVLATGIMASMELASGGCVPVVGPPVYMSDTPGIIRRPSPSLSADVESILRSINIPEDEISSLIKKRVIQAPQQPAQAPTKLS